MIISGVWTPSPLLRIRPCNVLFMNHFHLKCTFIFQDGGQTELNLWNVAGIFYILVAGLILSVVIACFEFIYKSKIDSRRSKVMYIFIFFFS